MPAYKPVGVDETGQFPPRVRERIAETIDSSAVTVPEDSAGVVMHGVFPESAKPTPTADGKTHIGWMIRAS